MDRRVAVVGAGYAGLAAASELAAAGVGVDVFEASRTLGGRARGVDIDGLQLDNGAHILVGAYADTLRLMRLVGAPADGLKRLPLHLEFPGRFRLRAPALPAPLHLGWALLTARGLRLTEKLAAIRFMRRLQNSHFRLTADMAVASLIATQPDSLRRFLWEPLCLAALNTPPDQASAQVFLNVLRDSLAADRPASDLLLPATDFSSLFPEPAARYVETHGGLIHRGRRVEAIRQREGGFLIDGHGPYDRAIVATAPQHAAALIGVLPRLTLLAQQIADLRFEPIVTIYLRYPDGVRLPWPMTGVDGGTAQWLFDRGALCGQPGVIAAVISARGGHEGLSAPQLAARIHDDVGRLVPNLPAPTWHRIIAEKRATFACTAGLRRPGMVTPLPGLLLAGDYVAGDYPATIEGAVRSGVAAAWSVLHQPPGGQP